MKKHEKKPDVQERVGKIGKIEKNKPKSAVFDCKLLIESHKRNAKFKIGED